MTTRNSTSDTMIHIALCDDQPEFIKQFLGCLLSCLEKKTIPFDITPFLSGEALLAWAFPFDVIFLDIRIDQQSGLDTARILRERNAKARIVFFDGIQTICIRSI